jgi:murein L,D-transpeptidase YafK
MMDNDGHLGITLESNVNNSSNQEIKSILQEAWQKKQTIILLQLLGYLENPVCYIHIFSNDEIENALKRFGKSIGEENLLTGDETTNMFLWKAYQNSDMLNCLPRLIKEQGLVYDNMDILLRVYKKELIISLWIRPKNRDQSYKLLKMYRITDDIVSTVGPKSALGDQLTPEGIYQLEFYPSFRWSDFYLAFKVSYPNDADKLRRQFWKIGGKAGGAINLHGCCVSIGCIPIGNPSIEELFMLIRTNQRNNSKVDIHIFPFKFESDEGLRILQTYKETKKRYYDFWQGLQEINQTFVKTKKIPTIKIDQKCGYYKLD